MKKKYKYEDLTNDVVFSEIDVKETSFKKKKDVELYSLNVLSDISSESTETENSNDSWSDSDSIDLDEYDLNIDEEQTLETINTLNTNEFFKCLIEIDNKSNITEKNKTTNNKLHKATNETESTNETKAINEDKATNENESTEEAINENKSANEEKEINEEKDFKIQYINDISDLVNVSPENLVVNKLHTGDNNELEETKSELQEKITELNETKIELNETKIKLEKMEEILSETIDKLSDTKDKLSEPIDKEIKESESKKVLENLNTSENYNIFCSILTDNYSQTDLQNIDINDKLKKFLDIASNENKNILGYIENNEVHKCIIKKPYNYEVHTQINIEDIDPPGNYINILFKKDLKIIKKMYLLQNKGYWILEPLENYIKYKLDINMKNILYIYFIILKLLYCNKMYPFNRGDIIKKYKKLTKTINLNLFNYINSKDSFRDYINTQLKDVFKLSETIENIVNIIDSNNINTHHTNILRLNYIIY